MQNLFLIFSEIFMKKCVKKMIVVDLQNGQL